MLRNSLRRLSSVVTLRARPPPNTAVTSACFTITNDAPPSPLEPHQLRCTTLLLSVDPFLRCRFNADPGVAYTSAYEIDAPIASAGIGVVTETTAEGFEPGDLVLEPFDAWPWADEVVLDASRVARVPRALPLLLPPSSLLGVVGQVGLTAYCGLHHHCAAPPADGDVLVVSGAAGAVGSAVGQLARRSGAAVVGICGTDAKADALLDLGFSSVVNYRSEALAADLDAALDGREVTHYFDNVGGDLSDLVISRMRAEGTVILCGQIASYDSDVPYPPPLPSATADLVRERRISRERYLVLDHKAHFAAALAEVAALVAGGELRTPETRYAGGAGGAADAFVSMMGGGNLGKALVEGAAAPPAWVRAAEAARSALPPRWRERLCRKYVTAEALAAFVS